MAVITERQTKEPTVPVKVPRRDFKFGTYCADAVLEHVTSSKITCAGDFKFREKLVKICTLCLFDVPQFQVAI